MSRNNRVRKRLHKFGLTQRQRRRAGRVPAKLEGEQLREAIRVTGGLKPKKVKNRFPEASALQEYDVVPG